MGVYGQDESIWSGCFVLKFLFYPVREVTVSMDASGVAWFFPKVLMGYG